MLLHDGADFGDLLDVFERDVAIASGVEEGYRLMHALAGAEVSGELIGDPSLPWKLELFAPPRSRPQWWCAAR